jgi:dipeptidyl aminopeptidase/acylaminoacyl peptidase
VHSTIDDGTDDVFVYRVVWDSIGDGKEALPARLNTVTGALRTLSHGIPDGTVGWLFDATHEPRVLTSYRKGRTTVYWRRPGDETWVAVAEFDQLAANAFAPWFVDRDGKIFVTAQPGGDTEGLYIFDPVAKRLDTEPVAIVAGYDLAPQPQVDTRTGQLVGLHFTADRPMSHWFDADLRRIQRSIDAALPPDRNNRLICGRCESARFIVIHSSSDRQPGEYFLFDRSKSSLQPIGASMAWIDEASQGRRSFHRVAARDGLQIPVYVTHPAGAAADSALPAVVLVHEGPWQRGSNLGWQAEAQFLASRGYRVIQPEFRGSMGYGFRHFKSGWKEWGRAMQDDLVDAVQWAAKQRLIDPARVCIMGRGYGGYAALMGPIASAGTYRCAASFSGVTDMALLYSITYSGYSQAALKYSMPVLVGDPEKDAQRMAAASPLKRVAEIKVPVMLAHGGSAGYVPMEHAVKFADAARRAGVEIEQVEYRYEGHGFNDPANLADYYRRLERFLEKSLQAPR